MTTSPLAARFQVLAAALLFSTGGMAVKGCELSGWQVASFRSGVAAVALWLLLPAARRRPSWPVVLVGLSYAVTLVLYAVANKLTTAANAIFLQSTAPLYVLLLGPWLLGERSRRRDLGVMAILALGLVMVLRGTAPASEIAAAPAAGNAVAACVGLTWALTVIGLRWLGRRDETAGGSVMAVTTGNVLACLLCLPLALPVVGSRPADWLWIVYLGLFQVALAYVFLNAGLRRLPAFEASLLLLVEPVFNPLWTWWLHGEVPARAAIAGGGLILLATVLKTWLDFRDPRKTPFLKEDR